MLRKILFSFWLHSWHLKEKIIICTNWKIYNFDKEFWSFLLVYHRLITKFNTFIKRIDVYLELLYSSVSVMLLISCLKLIYQINKINNLFFNMLIYWKSFWVFLSKTFLSENGDGTTTASQINLVCVCVCGQKKKKKPKTFYQTVSSCAAVLDLRLAMRLLLRPMPRHFSRWGANREAAMLRLQLGHTHSLFFHWLYTWPKMSTPGWSTISVKEIIKLSKLTLS